MAENVDGEVVLAPVSLSYPVVVRLDAQRRSNSAGRAVELKSDASHRGNLAHQPHGVDLRATVLALEDVRRGIEIITAAFHDHQDSNPVGVCERMVNGNMESQWDWAWLRCAASGWWDEAAGLAEPVAGVVGHVDAARVQAWVRGLANRCLNDHTGPLDQLAAALMQEVNEHRLEVATWLEITATDSAVLRSDDVGWVSEPLEALFPGLADVDTTTPAADLHASAGAVASDAASLTTNTEPTLETQLVDAVRRGGVTINLLTEALGTDKATVHQLLRGLGNTMSLPDASPPAVLAELVKRLMPETRMLSHNQLWLVSAIHHGYADVKAIAAVLELPHRTAAYRIERLGEHLSVRGAVAAVIREIAARLADGRLGVDASHLPWPPARGDSTTAARRKRTARRLR